MLPTFIGIGVPRAGSTWLHELLNSHPDAYVPTRRKEVHFFDGHYDRGLSWYEAFFPADNDAHRYKAIGEITPHYLYHEQVPHRIAQMESVKRLLLIVRNPVTRAYSHFRWRIRMDNYEGSFAQFLEDYPQAVEWGMYSRYVKHYFDIIPREQFLVLIHETALANVPATRQTICEFLDLDAARFEEGAGEQKVNISTIPKFGRARRVFSQLGRALRQRDLDWIPNLGGAMGINRLFGQRQITVPPMTDADRHRLYGLFEDSTAALEKLLAIDLACWREGYEQAPAQDID